MRRLIKGIFSVLTILCLTIGSTGTPAYASLLSPHAYAEQHNSATNYGGYAENNNQGFITDEMWSVFSNENYQRIHLIIGIIGLVLTLVIGIQILKIVNEHQVKGNNSSIKSAVMKTWGEHNSQDDPNNSDINFQIDPDRNVWVVITDFPNGIQTKAGFYDKATLTTVFDAESGQLLKSKVTGDYKGKGSKGNMK